MLILTFGIGVGRFCVALQQITARARLSGVKQVVRDRLASRMDEEPAMNDMPTAALDMGNRAAEDRDMDATIDTVRQEMNAGFKEVNARISELHREVTARIDDQRKELSTRIDDYRKELSARMDNQQKDLAARIDNQHRELSARIEELRRESNARIDGLRSEMLENFKLIDAKIEQAREETRASRRESMASIQSVHDRLDEHRRDHDRQFRWLLGLMLASLLGIAGMFAKAVHFY